MSGSVWAIKIWSSQLKSSSLWLHCWDSCRCCDSPYLGIYSDRNRCDLICLRPLRFFVWSKANHHRNLCLLRPPELYVPNIVDNNNELRSLLLHNRIHLSFASEHITSFQKFRGRFMSVKIHCQVEWSHITRKVLLYSVFIWYGLDYC